jgi:hypothetical protein
MVQSLQLGRSSRRRCGSIRHEAYFMARLIAESPKGKVYENSLVGSMVEPELRRMGQTFRDLAGWMDGKRVKCQALRPPKIKPVRAPAPRKLFNRENLPSSLLLLQSTLLVSHPTPNGCLHDEY